MVLVVSCEVPCEFEELLSRVDRKTGNDAEVNPASVKSKDVVKVKMPLEALKKEKLIKDGKKVTKASFS